MDQIACKVCGQVHELGLIPSGMVARCARCGSVLRRRFRGSLHLTGALALAALLLYIPANVFPILRLQIYGITTENTVWGGVIRFYDDGDLFLAAIVLMASIVIPFLKLLGLFTVVIMTATNAKRGKRFRTRVYRIIEVIGRWAMLDVFVLAIWVGLVKLNTLGKVTAGEGALPFGMVVMLTLLATAVFDPQTIWEQETPTP